MSPRDAKELSKAEAEKAKQTRLTEGNKVFVAMTDHHKKQKLDSDEKMRMSRILDGEYKRTEALGTQWTKKAWSGHALSGAHCSRHIRKANPAPEQ